MKNEVFTSSYTVDIVFKNIRNCKSSLLMQERMSCAHSVINICSCCDVQKCQYLILFTP